MTDLPPSARPAWQTDDLAEEWVEQDPPLDDIDDDDYDDSLANGSQSISFTTPLPTTIHTIQSVNDSALSSGAVGTFLVREDVAPAPLLPKTPGRNNKGLIKDFFTPLPLERMFEPPSPPNNVANPFPLSRQPSGSGQPSNSDGAAPNVDMQCVFTFTAPREGPPPPQRSLDAPLAQSTPNPPFHPTTSAPMTDPRLRLFQFQYDTYTREHLSAMVDSIAINTPSGDSPVNAVFTADGTRLSRVSEDTQSGEIDDFTRFRSAKRVKLSPTSDFYGEGAGAGTTILRRPVLGKDYVGESQSLMQKIKQARDYSTISTVASTPQSRPSSNTDVETPVCEHLHGKDVKPSLLDVPVNGSENTSAAGTTRSMGTYSSSSYRQQAADLMAAIKSDMKGSKRIFSGDTEASQLSSRDVSVDTIPAHMQPFEQKSNSYRGASLRHERTSSIRSSSSGSSRRNPGSRVTSLTIRSEDANAAELSKGLSQLSVTNSQKEGNPAPPPHLLVTAPSVVISNIENVDRRESSASLSPRLPPSYPTFSIRSGTNEDLNRFVSSSTASGTTLTSGTAPSFTKHAGPVQIRTIAPQDIPALPDKVGKMVFDKVMLKWVKDVTPHTGDGFDGTNVSTAGGDAEAESEDPFRDFDSLVDIQEGEHTARQDDVDSQRAMSQIEEVSEVEDEEEAELTSFSFDDPSAAMVHVMAGVDTDETTDSGDEGGLYEIPPYNYDEEDDGFDSDELQPAEDSFADDTIPAMDPMSVEVVPVASYTPQRPLHAPPQPIRSALKSTSSTPASAMKASSRSRHQTPANKHRRRRSVSFSDGKTDGPIHGLSRNDDGPAGGSALVGPVPLDGTPGFVPSARSKRLAEMMDALEASGAEDNESPTKTCSSSKPDELQPLDARQPNNTMAHSTRGSDNRRVFSRSQASTVISHRRNPATTGEADATFLTECSFGVAHDRLVQVITDVQPFEPHWEQLSHVDLSGRKIESVTRLKEFLPQLDSLCLNSNQISWLSGVPGSVRTLSVASNSLTALSSFGHLLNLESLDISKNDIDSLTQLACLRHLRELRADSNKITSIDGLQDLNGLVKLSLTGNCIRTAELEQCRWTRLEMLNLNQNKLADISGFASMPSLIALNVDNNDMERLSFDAPMSRLRILRASSNRLRALDVGPAPSLRTLYADNNALGGIGHLERLSRLENLSLRNQNGPGLNLRARDVRDVKRLYLSGNPLAPGFLSEPCYNLVYLELAACRLTVLPTDLALRVPNLRVLNLNYNFLSDVRPLKGLSRLRKISIIGSRLKETRPLIRILQGMSEVEVADFRCVWFNCVLVFGPCFAFKLSGPLPGDAVI
ncbi:hypothetical protein HGRIS_005895 [Hohenbuehelia grisea]|uniref:Septation initiation network scaffold protein cdc11 n=1 Tax=Hohenbuehelia grisea TaxID=104357 RepID=A0ABR3JZB3_9AGAR